MSETRKRGTIEAAEVFGPPDGVADFPADPSAWFAKGDVLRAELAPRIEALGLAAVEVGWNGWDVARMMLTETMRVSAQAVGPEALCSLLRSAISGFEGVPLPALGLGGQPETQH